MMGTVESKIRCGGEPMTAIVLAGGRGRRMKADKAGLAVGRRTLLEHVLNQLVPYFDEILVSVSPGQARRLGGPSNGKGLGGAKRAASGRRQKFKIIEDEVPGLGPLGGILAGLKAAANGACAVVACDIPDVNVALFRSLARAAGDAEIAVPVGPAGHFEPLFAVYRKSAVPEIEALLQAGERSILPLFGRCRTTVLRLGDAAWLRNLNTPADYESYLRTIATPAGSEKTNRPDKQAVPRQRGRFGGTPKNDQRPGRPNRP
jgi:molybdopterin-guanine dinucleotide biosynthesis protein A